MCQIGVLDPIPRTQHRPITITIRLPVTATYFPFRRRLNLKKANWSKFTNEIDQAIANIPAHPNHYNDFVDLMKKAACYNIPRGCQKEYITGLSDESSDLLKLYDTNILSLSLLSSSDTLLDEISDERRKIWRDMVENTNVTTNSNKHGQPSAVLGQTMSPLPWSLLSLLTKSLCAITDDLDSICSRRERQQIHNHYFIDEI